MKRVKRLTEHGRGQSIPGIFVEDVAVHVGAELEAIVGRLVPRRVYGVSARVIRTTNGRDSLPTSMVKRMTPTPQTSIGSAL